MTNSCHFIGRLVDDPKLYEGEPNRACFCLAVDRDTNKNGRGSADYLDFVAWKEAADYVVRHFNKGDLMSVVNARAKVRKYEDGEDRKNRVEFEVHKVYCIGRARKQPYVEE